MTRSKELLSQNEIDALLDIFNDTESGKTADIRFEVPMARSAKAIANMLEGLGVPFDDVRVLKTGNTIHNGYDCSPEYPYLERVLIENRLALGMLAAQYGAQEINFEFERELTSLEKTVFEKLCQDLVYRVEKELDDYLHRVPDDQLIADHWIVVAQGSMECAIQFSFRSASAIESTMPRPQEKKVVLPSDLKGTKLEAVLGTFKTEKLEKEAVYRVDLFGKTTLLLLLEGKPFFVGKRLATLENKIPIALKEAAHEPLRDFSVVIGEAMLDDEALLALGYETVMEMEPYRLVLIHKDGKIVAKAKLALFEDKITVTVL